MLLGVLETREMYTYHRVRASCYTLLGLESPPNSPNCMPPQHDWLYAQASFAAVHGTHLRHARRATLFTWRIFVAPEPD